VRVVDHDDPERHGLRIGKIGVRKDQILPADPTGLPESKERLVREDRPTPGPNSPGDLDSGNPVGSGGDVEGNRRKLTGSASR